MKILAIDSSGLVAGAAISDNGICVAEYNVSYKITHSQTLLPMTDEILSRVSADIADVDAYAVAAGPGSFTGLRIGIATVKGLALVHDKPVVAVPTLEALAFNAFGAEGYICPIMDARRDQVYTGIYDFERSLKEGTRESEPKLRCVIGQSAMAFEELCAKLNELGKSVMFIGDGIPVFKDRMDSLLGIPYSLAALNLNRQKASSLAALADHYLNSDKEDIAGRGLEGVITDAAGLTPVYLRQSQAEREKKSKDAG